MNHRAPVLVTLMFLGSLLAGTSLALEEDGPEWDPPENTEAGDARYRTDVQECLRATEDRSNVHCTALYPQITDPWTVHPLTIQRPPDCLDEMHDPLKPPLADPGWGLARYSFFYMAGFVAYNDRGCEQEASPMPAGWLNRDVLLDTKTPLVGYWHLSAKEPDPSDSTTRFFATDDQEDLETPPCITVRMALETGRDRGEGTVIAEGQTTKTLVTDHIQAAMPEPCDEADGEAHFDNVTRFRVELDEPKKTIPQFDGFILHVQWFYHERGARNNPVDEDRFTPKQWSLHTDHEQPNRIVLPTSESLEIAPLELERDDDHLRVTTDIRSTFGVHDLDPESVRLAIFDEEGSPVETDGLGPSQNQVSATPESINVSTAWQVPESDLPPGNYTARVTAANWQHTYEVQQQDAFTVGPGMEIGLPEDNRTATTEGVGPAFNPMPMFALSFVGFLVAAVVSIGVSRRRDRWR